MALQLQNIKIKGTDIEINPYVRLTWYAGADGNTNEVTLHIYENKQAFLDNKRKVDVDLALHYGVFCEQDKISVHNAIQEIVGGEIVDLN
jgi:hypothetical protein